jgi:hypothetical protein
MIRSLVIITVLCLCGASASAAPLTMQECRAKYKAAVAARAAGDSWVGFQDKQCGIKPPPSNRRSHAVYRRNAVASEHPTTGHGVNI